MILQNLHWYSAGKEGFADIRISTGVIEEIAKGLAPRFREKVLDLQDCLALPGLINAHDHLDFNLLSLTGNPPYTNFTQYASDVYKPDESPVKEMLNVDMRDRFLWGGYKNLISGVTTVCHHNPLHRVCNNGFPIRVVQDVAWTHSLTYSSDPLADFQKARGRPFIIHAAEGTDAAAQSEIAELQRLGMLDKNTVLVHGVGITEIETPQLQNAGVALIWCPGSNLRLFGQTAPVTLLRNRVKVTLGTDSLLTGSPTLFDELRAGLGTGLATPEELLQMVTTKAAEILKIPKGAGTLSTGARADLTVLPDVSQSIGDTLLNSKPADLKLVVVGGAIRLADESLDSCKANIEVGGRGKFVSRKLAKLQSRILKKLGAQAKELIENPLWQMIHPM